jgi:arsenate reductase (thioredoxin)
VGDSIYNVLFLCTGNSARSIFAEVLLNRWGQRKFRAFSAGSHPKGEVHPLALALLTKYGIATEGLRSKSWEEFEKPGAARLDFVFTVCDKAAAEICPAWPGQPMTAHWGVEDPAAVEGTDATKAQAFRQALHTLEARIRLFISIPIAKLDTIKLKARVDEIGRAPASLD